MPTIAPRIPSRGGDSPGRPRGRFRLPARLASALAVSLAAAACAPQSVVMVGETPVPPPQASPVVTVLVVDDLGDPIPGAEVATGELQLETDEQGQAGLEWEGNDFSVQVKAPGFFPSGLAVKEFQEEPLELQLRPVLLRGAVLDPSGYGLAGASVTLNDQQVGTDDNGRFEVVGATQGILTAARPGWHDAQLDWDGDSLVIEMVMQPRIIRALHIAADIPGDVARWGDMLDVAATTVVNSFVVDVKNESGRIFYNSGVELARTVGAVTPRFDLERVVAEMEAADLYKIARIVTFQDPIAAAGAPDLAVHNTATGGPFNKRGQYFLDPTDPQARAYALDLAGEVCAAGFEEIQFDYVRFPDGYPSTAVFDGGSSEEVRVEAIASFLNEAGDILHPMGCAVAADIFGFITSVNNDGGIGQEFNRLSATADVLSPMVYPSHYSTGWFGYQDPNSHPGPVVGSALDDGMTRLAGPAIVRPWLQDFYYNASQVRAQIEAAESRSMGWMLWNAFSRFQWAALDSAPEPEAPEEPAEDGEVPEPAPDAEVAEAAEGEAPADQTIPTAVDDAGGEPAAPGDGEETGSAEQTGDS